MIEKCAEKGRDRDFTLRGKGFASHLGGDCLGISPPTLKGKESKEAHEPGHMQDLKLKNIKRKTKENQNISLQTS